MDCGPPDLESVHAERSPEGQTHCDRFHLPIRPCQRTACTSPSIRIEWRCISANRKQRLPRSCKSSRSPVGKHSQAPYTPTPPHTHTYTHACTPPPLTYNKHTHTFADNQTASVLCNKKITQSQHFEDWHQAALY